MSQNFKLRVVRKNQLFFYKEINYADFDIKIYRTFLWFLQFFFQNWKKSPILPGYLWENYEDIELSDSCKIACASKQTNSTGKPYYSTISARNGIPCTEGWNNGLCISGKCHIIGCDGRLSLSKRTGFLGKSSWKIFRI